MGFSVIASEVETVITTSQWPPPAQAEAMANLLLPIPFPLGGKAGGRPSSSIRSWEQTSEGDFPDFFAQSTIIPLGCLWGI